MYPNRKWGKKSLRVYNTLHPDLQMIVDEALRVSPVDFSLIEGYRTTARQNKLYSEGKSKIDGITRIGKHNLKPSHAVDLVPYHPDKDIRNLITWDKVHLAFLAGVLFGVSIKLFKAGTINHLLRWGANWDRDGVLHVDQTFDDYPHFELFKPRSDQSV